MINEAGGLDSQVSRARHGAPALRQQAERVARLGGYGRWREGQREGCAVVPVVPLVAIVGRIWVAAFAEDDVLRGAIDVAPVHGEALRGAEGAADLFHRRGVAAEGLLAGSGYAACGVYGCEAEARQSERAFDLNQPSA